MSYKTIDFLFFLWLDHFEYHWSLVKEGGGGGGGTFIIFKQTGRMNYGGIISGRIN